MSNAEQLLTTAVGATIGFFVGGPAGALAGAQYGLLAGSILFPADLPGIQGPRLEDFEQLHADPGAPIAQVFGTHSVPGFRLYLGPVTEISSTEEVGGKGAPSQDVTTFTYLQTLALGLCEGPIGGILRVWENGTLVYDGRPQQEGEDATTYAARVAMSNAYEETFTLYLGDEGQLPDPTLEEEQGAGNVPGYRGLAYIVFPNRQLKEDQARRHPVFKIEVVKPYLPPVELDVAKVCDVEDWTAGTGNGARFDGSVVVEQQVTLDRVDDNGTWSHRWRQRTFTLEGEQQGSTTTHLVAAPVQLTSSHFAYAVENSGSIWLMVEFSGQFRRWCVGGTISGDDFELPDGHDFHSTVRPFMVLGRGVYQITGSSSPGSAFGKWLTRWRYNELTDGAFPGHVPNGTIKIVDESLSVGNVSIVGSDSEDNLYIYHLSTQKVYRTPYDLSFLEEVGSISGTTSGSTVRVTVKGDFIVAGQSTNSNYRVLDNTDLSSMLTFDASEAGLPATARAIPIGLDLLYYPSLDKVWRLSELGQDPQFASLASIIREICTLAGLDESILDASDHDDTEVLGYSISRQTTALAALEPLRMFGRFDIVESAGLLKFPARGAAAVATLDSDDLGAYAIEEAPPPPVTTDKLQDFELPRQIRLRYPSLARDYEFGEQLSPARIGTFGVNDVTIECSVVMEDETAAQLAEILFREAWASRYSHAFNLGPDHHSLEPGDVVMLPVDGRLRRVRVVTIDDAGLMVRRVFGVRDDDGSYVSIAIADTPRRPPTLIELVGETTMVLLDLPALREEDDDAGFYLAAYRTGVGQSWSGARIYRSVDEGATYQQIAAITAQATVGTVDSAPEDGDSFTWDDESELVVTLTNGELESRTDAAVLSGANAAAIGSHGRWQIIQFANAELIGTNQYRLTRLLLGRRGTEHLIGHHQGGDKFVLISGPGIYRMPLQAADIGASRLYQAITAGMASSEADGTAFTGQGQALECFAPVYVEGDRDTSGDLTISWLRRDRLAQPLRDGVPLEMSESSLAFEVDILDGDEVVRTLEASSEEVVYTATDQTSDFGSPQSSVAVRVYQLSAKVGRGLPAEATV